MPEKLDDSRQSTGNGGELHQVAGGISQVTLDRGISTVLPHAESICEPYRRSNIVGQLPLEIVLNGVVNVSRTDCLVGSVGGIRPAESARNGHNRSSR